MLFELSLQSYLFNVPPIVDLTYQRNDDKIKSTKMALLWCEQFNTYCFVTLKNSIKLESIMEYPNVSVHLQNNSQFYGTAHYLERNETTEKQYVALYNQYKRVLDKYLKGDQDDNYAIILFNKEMMCYDIYDKQKQKIQEICE